MLDPQKRLQIFTHEKDRYDYYRERVAECLAVIEETTKTFDDKLVTLAAGSITLSITFLGLSERSFHSLTVLYLSWLAFFLSIALNLWTHRSLRESSIDEKGYWDAWYKSESNDPNDVEKNDELAQKINKIEELSWAAFLSGLLLLGVFMIVNASR